ncbi:immunoglobulin-binding protein 1 isoform X1 [Saccopteryx bilineata]|uniref:immunoglobulin-binding protein 1 isoform X1 n=1 Tax=Saccopteryx bilineata TaxID=59482 RepID=UPI00338DA721
MAAAAEDESLPPRLTHLFEASKQLLDEVEETSEPSGSRAVQEKVLQGLFLLKTASEMLSQLDLFSQNEDLEEIASADLKYMMVPAFQGAFTMKQVSPSKRLDHLQWAREHFLKYLTQCRHYHVAEFELPKTTNNSTEKNTASSSMAQPNLVAMASQRQAKIERYRQKKEMERRLSALKSAVENGEADDEHVREYYLLHLRRWIGISLEELDSIDQEIKILREKDSSKEASTSRSSDQARPPMRPFILTRNAAQAKVFGAGYPSLATMTVNEWYDQHRNLGVLPDQGIAKTTSGGSAASGTGRADCTEPAFLQLTSTDWTDGNKTTTWRDCRASGSRRRLEGSEHLQGRGGAWTFLRAEILTSCILVTPLGN